MKRIKYLIILIIGLLVLPGVVFASGNITVSTTNLKVTKGSTSSFTINAKNSAGRIDISSSNTNIVTVSETSIFLDMQSSKITVSGKSVGSTTIKVTIVDATTYDDEDLTGITYTINVTVNEPVIFSKNNKLKSLNVEGYNIVKVNENDYNLTVEKDVDNINVIAIAEDEKAKINGNGRHQLIIGENNIEIVVIAESGLQNKISLKVTRKEGYYIEDLEELIKDNTLSVIDIIIHEDTKISKEILTKIKEGNKKVNLNFYDKNKNFKYGYTLDSTKINNTKDFKTTIFTDLNTPDNIIKLSNYAEGKYIKISDYFEGVITKIYVGEQYKDNVNIYYYENGELKLLKDNIKVSNGYVETEINKSEIFITKANLENQNNNSLSKLFIKISLVELIIIIVVSIILVWILKKYNILKVK